MKISGENKTKKGQAMQKVVLNTRTQEAKRNARHYDPFVEEQPTEAAGYPTD